MAQVYSRATCVIAWIGRLEEQVHRDGIVSNAFDVANFVEYLAKQRQKRHRDESYSRDWSQYASVAAHKSLGNKAGWTMLLNFCRRSYWTRLWILQELVLASHITVQCDLVTISLSYLDLLLEHWSWEKAYIETFKNLPESRDRELPFWKIPDTVLFKISRQRKALAHVPYSESNLFDIVYTFRDAACENMLDRVYGLLGFAFRCCREALQVRYDINPEELCVSLLQHYFTFHNVANRWDYLTTKTKVLLNLLYKSNRTHNASACLGNLLGSKVSFGYREPRFARVQCEIMGMVLAAPVWTPRGMEISLEHAH